MRSRFHPEAREEFLAAMWTEIAPGIRRCLLKRFPYAILYSQEADALFIYAVMHMHRDPDYWRHRI